MLCPHLFGFPVDLFAAQQRRNVAGREFGDVQAAGSARNGAAAGECAGERAAVTEMKPGDTVGACNHCNPIPGSDETPPLWPLYGPKYVQIPY